MKKAAVLDMLVADKVPTLEVLTNGLDLAVFKYRRANFSICML